MGKSQTSNYTNEIKIPEVSIYQLFEQRVDKSAPNIAVIDGDNSLTFSELKEKIEMFASVFLIKGLKKETVLP